jgi:hypothetical protein
VSFPSVTVFTITHALIGWLEKQNATDFQGVDVAATRRSERFSSPPNFSTFYNNH